jgi:predicted RNA-binding protein YlqC (UPF0109 family)
MIDLVEHLVRPVVQNPDEVRVHIVEEGDAAVMMELCVHQDDHAVLEDDRGRVLRAIRSILSAAVGSKKATVDLVETFSARGEE